MHVTENLHTDDNDTVLNYMWMDIGYTKYARLQYTVYNFVSDIQT